MGAAFETLSPVKVKGRTHPIHVSVLYIMHLRHERMVWMFAHHVLVPA